MRSIQPAPSCVLVLDIGKCETPYNVVVATSTGGSAEADVADVLGVKTTDEDVLTSFFEFETSSSPCSSIMIVLAVSTTLSLSPSFPADTFRECP